MPDEIPLGPGKQRALFHGAAQTALTEAQVWSIIFIKWSIIGSNEELQSEEEPVY